MKSIFKSDKAKIISLSIASTIIPLFSWLIFLYFIKFIKYPTESIFNIILLGGSLYIGVPSGVIFAVIGLYKLFKSNNKVKGNSLIMSLGIVFMCFTYCWIYHGFLNVRHESQEKVALNGCRRLSNAADQYYIEYGVRPAQNKQEKDLKKSSGDGK